MGPDQMSSNSKMFNIEKLAADGANWITWKGRMLSILEALNLTKNIKGTACIPPEPTSYPSTHHLMIKELETLKKQEKHLDDYQAHEGLAKAHIFNAVVDSLLLKIQMLMTAKEVWDMVCREYEQKLLMVQVNL